TQFSAGFLNFRKISELPWQLCQLNDWYRLKTFLVDIPNLMALRQISPLELHGYWLALKPYYDPARVYQQSLQAFVGSRPPEEKVADAMTSLGHFFGSWGEVNICEQMHRDALAIRERVLGPDHLDTLNSAVFLANSLAPGLDEAEALHRRVLATRTRVLG